MSKKLYLILILISLVLLINSVFYGDVVIDKIVARINGSVITMSEYQVFKNYLNNRGVNIPEEKIVESLVETELFFQIASDNEIMPSFDDIEKEVKTLRKNSRSANDEAFLAALQKEGFSSLEMFKYEIKKRQTLFKLTSFLVQNHVVEEPDESELKDVYQNNKERFQEKEKVKISHILIKLEKNEHWDQLKEKTKLADRILAQIRTGQTDFETQALNYSDDRENNKLGGLLGWYDYETLKKLSPEYAQKAFSLKNGEVSDIIFTDLGYHIIKRLDYKGERKLSFFEAKEFIKNDMLQQKAIQQIKKMVDLKKKKSIIELYLK